LTPFLAESFFIALIVAFLSFCSTHGGYDNTFVCFGNLLSTNETVTLTGFSVP
jgi:hypothetical protein